MIIAFAPWAVLFVSNFPYAKEIIYISSVFLMRVPVSMNQSDKIKYSISSTASPWSAV